jgi:hypothetical protein
MGPPTDRELMVEMNHIAQDVFRKLGISPEEERTAALRARKTRTRSHPSARLMAAINGAGDVLSTWRRDKRYLGSDGSPRVLPIRGPGATLQTLVRKFAPHMRLEEVLAYICSHGEATRYKGDRVALLGSAAVLTQRTPEVTLAWMLTQFRHVADTAMHNAAIPAHQVKGVGLFQRQVAGPLVHDLFADSRCRRDRDRVDPRGTRSRRVCAIPWYRGGVVAGLPLAAETFRAHCRGDCGLYRHRLGRVALLAGRTLSDMDPRRVDP